MGDTVKVYSMLKKCLYRAKILKNNYNGWYEVFCIDFGNIESVLSDNIYELDYELQKKVLFYLLVNNNILFETIMVNRI